MASKKNGPLKSPKQRALDARVAAARGPSSTCPTYVWEGLVALAADTQIPFDGLRDEWSDRVESRVLTTGQARVDAERSALGDVIAAYAGSFSDA